MSRLLKLDLRGARSYMPDNPQSIEFDSPLTIILGKNGTGKTTIIECIRCALTGKVNGQQRDFVTNAGMLGTSNSAGRLELQFHSAKNCTVMVTKEIRTENDGVKTSSSSRPEFKILENGAWKSVSMRSGERSYSLEEHTGIGKILLEYAILCHQTENTWPLDKKDKLKARFDDIFDTTRYTAALKQLQDEKKAAKKEKEACEADMSTAAYRAEDAEKQLSQIEEKENELKKAVYNCSRAAGAIQGAQKRLDEVSAEYASIKAEYTEYVELQRAVEKQAGKFVELEDALPLDWEELLKNSACSSGDMQALNETVKKLREECDTAGKKLAEERASLDNAKRSLMDLHEKEENLSHDREAKIQAVQNLCSLLRNTIIFDKNEEIDSVIKTVQEIEFRRDDLDREIGAYEKQIRDLNVPSSEEVAVQNTLQGQRDELHKCQMEASLCVGKRRELEANVKRGKEELAAYQMVEIEKDSREGELRKAREERAQRNYESELNAFEKAIDDLKDLHRERTALDAQITEETQRIFTLITMDFIQKFAAEFDDTDLSKVSNPEEFVVGIRVHGIPRVAQTIEQRYHELEKRGQQLIDEYRKCREEQSLMNGSMSEKENILNDMKAKRGQEQQAFMALSVPDNFEGEIPRLEREICEDEESIRQLESCAAYEKFKKAAEESHTCPLCCRGLDHDSMGNLMRVVTQVLSKTDILPQMKQELARKKMMLGKFVAARNHSLEIARLSSAILESERVLSEQRSSLESIAVRANIITTQMAANSQRLPDVASLRETFGNVARSSERIDDIQKKSRGKKSVLDIGTEREGIERQKSALCSEMNQMDRMITELERDVAVLGEKVVKKQMLSRQNDDMTKQWYQSKDKSQQLENRIAQLNQVIERRQQELSEKTAARERIREEVDKKLESKKERKLIMEKCLSGCSSSAFQKLKEDSEMCRTKRETCERNIEVYSREIRMLEDECRARTDVLDKKQKQLDLMVQNGAVLDRIHEYLEVKSWLEENRGALEAKDAKYAGESMKMRYERARQAKHEVKTDISTLEKESTRFKALKETLEADIASRRENFHKSGLEDAGERYQELIQKAGLLMVKMDEMTKIEQVVIKSMSDFHHEKIRQVNTIIEDLWQGMYSSHDISTIFIDVKEEKPQTEDVSADGTRKSKDIRTKYSYTVMMRKGGSNMEMHKGCSAGQRVLASLVIRMALAEAFCENCGFLVLDEPTTNLDRDNVRQLGEKLCSLLHSPRGQAFQLIVITHDKDFARSMRNFTGRIWVTSMDTRNRSTIASHPVEEFDI